MQTPLYRKLRRLNNILPTVNLIKSADCPPQTSPSPEKTTQEEDLLSPIQHLVLSSAFSREKDNTAAPIAKSPRAMPMQIPALAHVLKPLDSPPELDGSEIVEVLVAVPAVGVVVAVECYHYARPGRQSIS